MYKCRIECIEACLSGNILFHAGATAAPGSGPTNCTFEDVYICNYIQDLTDNFNWTRQSGSTSSSNTGPSSDHTYGTSAGHYMYIEASSPARPGQLARLFTPKYPAVNQDQCLQFYYHMYGSQIGKLNVKVGVGMSNEVFNLGQILVWFIGVEQKFSVSFSYDFLVAEVE